MAYRPTARTEARRLDTRHRILDAAEQRVRTGGFAAVAKSVIAAAADVATGTLYRHFDNKADLCTELFRSASRREVDEVRRVTERPGSATGRLADTARNFARRAIRGRHLAYALIAEPLDPALEEERLLFRRAYADLFKALLDDGIAAGEFEAMDTGIAATALVGTMAETLVGPLAPANEPMDPTQQQHLADELSRFCLRAVGQQRSRL